MEEDAERTAHILGMLIDGIWVRAGLQLEALSGTAAISEMEYAILKMLPNDKASISEHKLARQKIEDVAKILFSSKAYREKVNQL